MVKLPSQIKDFVRYLQGWSEEKKLFSSSLLFLSIIFFVPNNKIFVLVSILFILGLYLVWNNLIKSILYAYIFLLPFQNGKGINFMVVPDEFVYGNIPFTIIVSFTMSAVLSIILLYIHIRNKLFLHQKQSSIHIKLSDICICLYILTNIIASINSNISLLSFLLTLQICGYIFVFYFIQHQHLKQWIRKLLIPLIASLCIFNGILSGLQYINIGSPGYINPTTPDTILHVASEDTSFFRMQGIFHHPNFLGFFMAIFIPTLFYYSISKYTSSFSKTISAFGFIFGLIALILSGSRASWIFFAISMIVILRIPIIYLSFKILPSVKRLYFICLIMCLIAIPTYALPRFSQLAVTFSYDEGAQFRIDLITKSILTALRYPSGIGLGLFPQILLIEIGEFTSTPTQPHNLLAQILVASGFLGMISFIIFLYLKIKACLSIKIKKPIFSKITRYLYVISLGCFFFLSMFYPILTEQQIFGWLWILLSILV